ncbi:acyltransferase [Pseudomonas seleniipraecipitans]|uniref:Acyltransferase n=1 Tax=Phytopseudomonas seleniipraecipitans TaxID=640205 RepID=A0ABY5JAI6_9GAMM|nr:acyltransferase [Pseudomonas seleniipraecipitans]UUD65069.1 acyltransferase [Pseudomonas seleniipraecipitans]
MTRTDKEHFIGLEWLRFILGLYIVVFHTLHNYAEQKLPIIKQLSGVGFFATSTFFVLSGFLLAHVYCKRGDLREPAMSFWSKRFANLYPLHIFSLLLTIAVIFIISNLGIPPDETKATIRFVVYDTNEDMSGISRTTLEHFMGNGELAFNTVLQLFMLQAWNPLYLTFNPPLWSISTLFFFYLTFPFVAPRLARLKHKVLWLGVLTLIYMIPPIYVILNGDFGMPFTGILHRNPLVRLPEFLAGILAYGLFRDMRDAGRQPGAAGIGLMIATVLTCFFGAAWLVEGEQYWYYLLHNGLLLPSQMMLIYLCALMPSPSSEPVRRWSQRLGAASLPLFVLHVPAFTLFSRSEKVLGVASGECFANWSECAIQAGEQTLSIAFYPLFLLLTVILCVWAQENAVVPTRKQLLKWLPVRRSTS